MTTKTRNQMCEDGDIVEVTPPMFNENPTLRSMLKYYQSIAVFFDVHNDLIDLAEHNGVAYEKVLQMIGADFVEAVMKAKANKVEIGQDFSFPVKFELDKGTISMNFRAVAHPEKEFNGATNVHCLTFLYQREE